MNQDKAQEVSYSLGRMMKKMGELNEQASTTTYNGWANYDTWNVMLWLDNDEELYRDTCRYFEVIRRERKRPTYKGLIAWLSDGNKIVRVTPDDVFWLGDTLNYTELNRGVVSNFDAWKQYN
jgi:hypothetical protein